MKRNSKTIIVFLLCISIFLNIYLVSMLSYKQNRIDRVLKYSHFGAAGTVNIILKDLKKKLVDVDEGKLEDRSYVIDTLEDTHYKLFLSQLILDKLRLVNDNYDFDISPLSGYIFQLKESYQVSGEGLTKFDKETLKEITDIHLYTSLTGFYEEVWTYGIKKPKNPKEYFKEPYKKLEDICNHAIIELNKQH